MKQVLRRWQRVSKHAASHSLSSQVSFSPPSDCISFPSMMTWAPCPHGIRTRGKKHSLSSQDTDQSERGSHQWDDVYGVPMRTALDLCIVWSLYGLYMCKHFWPCPAMSTADLGPGGAIRWPRQSHPGHSLQPPRATPWLTSWARPPSNRESSPCSQRWNAHALPHHCRGSIFSRPVRCHVTECGQPFFMPLEAKEHRLLCVTWRSRAGKRCQLPC